VRRGEADLTLAISHGSVTDTVIVFVILGATAVAVLIAVIVIVPVTLGGGVTVEVTVLPLPLPPLPQPVINTADKSARPVRGRDAFLATTRVVAKTSIIVPSERTSLPLKGPSNRGTNPTPLVFVFDIVTVVVPDPVTDPGMEHVVLFPKVDGTEHVNDTVPVKAPTAATESVAFAEEEPAMVSADELIERL
jgi:hypothetical protein